MELEKQNESLQTVAASCTPILSRRDVLGIGENRGLPATTCQYTMTGHRNPITVREYHSLIVTL